MPPGWPPPQHGTSQPSDPDGRHLLGFERSGHGGRDVEAAVELPCLPTVVSRLSMDEVPMPEILRAGPHTANVFHRGDGCRIVGVVLPGKPGLGLPKIPLPRSPYAPFRPRARARKPVGQLDLFARIEL